MKKNKKVTKWWLALVLSMMLVLSGIIIPEQTVQAEVKASGECGENLTWTLEDGVLTISGKGDMTNYNSISDAPWYENRTSITKVVIEEGVTSIGDRAFPKYSNLISVEISSSVKRIGNYTFKDNGNFQKVSIAKNSQLTDIGTGAFSWCTKLEEFQLPTSVENIGESAFSDCESLTTMEIGPNVLKIDVYAFTLCDNLKFTVDNNNPNYASTDDGALYNKNFTTLLSAPGASGEFVIPSSVTTITSYAFYYCPNITSVTIPANVESIEKSAFEGAKVSNITFEKDSKLTTIGEAAFCECIELETIFIPANVTTIECSAFSSSGLHNLSFASKSSLKKIESGAFNGCKNLQNIIIPNSVNTIEKSAFGSMDTDLTEIIILSPNVVLDSDFVINSDIKTLIYPSVLNLDFLNEKVDTKFSFTDEGDGTISLFVEKIEWHIPLGMGPLTLPDDIDGKPISSIAFANDIDTKNIIISHTTEDNHYYAAYDIEDASSHREICTVCGYSNPSAVPHNYGDGTETCICGYIPFTVSNNSTSCFFTYGSTERETLSVSVTETLSTETLAYQWKWNDEILPDATTQTYTVPADLKAGNYVYSCTISANSYNKTVEIPVHVSKKPITIQADSKEKTEGEENPELTFTITEGAFVSGDTIADWIVSMNTTATKDSAPGTYEITGTATSENYEITVTSGTLTINARQVTPPVPDNPNDNPPGGSDTPSGGSDTPNSEVHKKGAEIKDTKKQGVYKVTGLGNTSGKVGTVEYSKPAKKTAKTVTIPATIQVDGVTYKVTGIAANAFKNNKSITKVTIGSNVKNIGANAFYKCTKLETVNIEKNVNKIGPKAFYGCSKLKTLTIKSTKLTTKKIGSKAFGKTPKSVTVKVPKKKFNAYKSMLIKRGVNKKAKFKKS